MVRLPKSVTSLRLFPWFCAQKPILMALILCCLRHRGSTIMERSFLATKPRCTRSQLRSHKGETWGLVWMRALSLRKLTETKTWRALGTLKLPRPQAKLFRKNQRGKVNRPKGSETSAPQSYPTIRTVAVPLKFTPLLIHQHLSSSPNQ